MFPMFAVTSINRRWRRCAKNADDGKEPRGAEQAKSYIASLFVRTRRAVWRNSNLIKPRLEWKADGSRPDF